MGGSPATPLRLGRHEGSPGEQDTAPDQADGDAAALATGIRCGGARRLPVRRTGGRRGRRWDDDRRGSRRADVGIGLLTFDLHDDRPALGVRELLTDEDLAVLGLATELPLTRIGLSPVWSLSSSPGVPTYLHTHTCELAGAACAGAENATRPAVAMVAAALMDSSRRAADTGVVVVVAVMVYLAGCGIGTERMIHRHHINPICPTRTTALS